MIGLTHKQSETFEFIKAYVAEAGVGPTYDEIAANAGLNSKSGVHRLISALEERQMIRRIPNRARAIEVINPQLDTLGFLPPEVLSIVENTANANKMLPETLVAQIVTQWAISDLRKVTKRRGTRLATHLVQV